MMVFFTASTSGREEVFTLKAGKSVLISKLVKCA